MSSRLEMRWVPPPGVRAVFTVRTAGVSGAPFDSLNVATHVGDDPAAVARNRSRLRAVAALPAEPVWLEQVHGTRVVDLDGIRASAGVPPIGDASVASMSHRVCAIQVADCLPVLFARRDGSRVGAAHAGWRGLAAGVLEATVDALGNAAELVAWIGPAISQARFEVGAEVRAAFVSDAPAAQEAFVRNARGRWQCDLAALARQRLSTIGLDDVHGGAWCTFDDREQFFSYRRDGRCGRMAALIWRA
ncbi:MAG: peptidoglycan editing factor PgeF [Pseudomonadales bacterium]|nr:peptidoglycan editing factor PgeF [Pseudomonadales bacterium]